MTTVKQPGPTASLQSNQQDPKTQQQSQLSSQVHFFQEFEQRDEAQILAEMRGEVLQDMVYDTTISGKRVTDLSYAGKKEAIRRRGNYAIIPCDCCHKAAHIEEDAQQYRALVRVRDLTNNVDMLGASASDKNKPFAWTLAINKSERNAFTKLLPAKWLTVLIREFLDRQSGKTTQQNNSPVDAISRQVPATPELLDNLPWQPMAKNPQGSWVYSNLAEASALVDALVKAVDKTLTFGDYTYKLSGEHGKFVNRWPHKEEKLE